jgi:hypothetical protein
VTYEVFSVSAPRTADHRVAPRGAPAVKMAKASNRAFPGGNESARMPNLINNVCQLCGLARMKGKAYRSLLFGI